MDTNKILYILSYLSTFLAIISSIRIFFAFKKTDISKMYMYKLNENRDDDEIKEKIEELKQLEKLIEEFPKEERPELEYIKMKNGLKFMIEYYQEEIDKSKSQ